MRYVALFRGINVGGRNKLAMADVREVFEAHRFKSVSTYIQSGNVLFDSARAPSERALEELLEQRFGFPIVVLVRSQNQLRNIVANAPGPFGKQPGTHHSDVIFLKAPLTPRRALGLFDPREGVDRVWAGTGVLYFDRVSARRTESRLSRIVAKPEYQLMTIRSWSTTTKLCSLLDSGSGC